MSAPAHTLDKPSDIRSALRDLANRIDRLAPDSRDPERFHVEKDEIAHELRRLAREGC